MSFADQFGIPEYKGSTDTTTKKSGTYTRTQISSNLPNDLALEQTINQIFKQFYGRSATQSELDIYLPEIRNLYKGPDGKTKSTIKETYVNGNLVTSEYFTADNQDPKLWLTDKIKSNLLAGKQEVNKSAIPEGPSGKYFIELKNLASKNGIMLSDSAATDYSNKIVAGTIDADTASNIIRESAASAFPQFADKIKSGVNLQTLADPWIQSMSSILEIPYTSIDLFDPTIRGAISRGYPKVTATSGMGGVSGGEYTIYDFEKDLRQDPRWQYTKNAEKTVSSATLKVLQDFGMEA